MTALLGSLSALGASTDWLITANLILSLLLGRWMMRYRRLYLASSQQQRNAADLIENLSEGVYRSAPDGRQLSANKALVELNGYTTEEEMLAGITDIGKEWYVEPGRRDKFREILHREGHVRDFVSEIYRHKTRERIWISESARLVYDSRTGEELFYEGSVREITETLGKLRFEEQFQKLTSRLPVGLFHFVRRADGTAEVLLLTESASRVSGIPVAEQIANPAIFSTLVFPEDFGLYIDSLRNAEQNLEPWDCQFRIRARDGVEKWVRIDALPEAVNGEVHWYGYIADISVRKRQEMEIEELAFFDPLTKLPNRRMLLDRLQRAVADCDAGGRQGAVLFIDLDHFKSLNDTLGHDVGDAFLIQVADRLRASVSERDLVARIGGDEFVVVLETRTESSRATLSGITTANRIQAELNRGFDLGERRHVGSASIGVVQFGTEREHAEGILKKADLAMYQAKSGGRNGVALFDPAIMDLESERLHLLNELIPAFERGEFELYFQPQVDHAGKVVGAEALVRWNHPTRGLLLPDRFVALAESNGMNEDLSRFVFEAGLQTLSRWSTDPRTSHLRLALNVGVGSFASSGFVPMLRRLMEQYPVEPGRLTVELTEHVMARDAVQIAARMNEMKDLGVRLSLDDFGTGYSSLAYLKRLPFDEVKIDGGFVSDIEGSESDRALVKTILAMARTLGLKTVAEHVENIRQEAYLRAFGCDLLQGHLYSRALPEAEFRRLFEPAGPAMPAAARRLA